MRVSHIFISHIVSCISYVISCARAKCVRGSDSTWLSTHAHANSVTPGRFCPAAPPTADAALASLASRAVGRGPKQQPRRRLSESAKTAGSVTVPLVALKYKPWSMRKIVNNRVYLPRGPQVLLFRTWNIRFFVLYYTFLVVCNIFEYCRC